MKNSFRIFVLALVILFTGVNAFGDELSNVKDQLGDVKDSINEKKEHIESIEKEQDSVEAQISNLDAKMSSTSAELDKLRDEISAADKAIASLEKDIKEKEESLEEEKKLMDARINALYRSGAASYLSILMESKDLSELLERAVFVKRIIEHDKALVEEILKTKEAIEAKKAEMDQKRNSLSNMKKKSDSKYSDLKEQTAEKSSLVKELEKDKAKYEKQLAQEEADAKALQAKIKKLESQFKPTNTKSVSITGTKYRISSYYGLRMHPVLGYQRFHHGIDIATPMGTSIYSLRDGIVIFSGVMSGYGNVVMVNHGDITSLYAHNSSIAVREGQEVKGGQLVARSGNSGLSSGPHLHFEIRNKSGDSIDPISYYK